MRVYLWLEKRWRSELTFRCCVYDRFFFYWYVRLNRFDCRRELLIFSGRFNRFVVSNQFRFGKIGFTWTYFSYEYFFLLFSFKSELTISVLKSQSGDGDRLQIFGDSKVAVSSGITAKRPRCRQGDVGP